MRHLNVADKLLVMTSEGTLAAQGTYEELRSTSETFTSMLTTLRQLDMDQEPAEAAPSKDNVPEAVKGPSAEQQQDLARRTGDVSIYKYYIGSVGWTTLAMLATSNAIYAFGLTFPRK